MPIALGISILLFTAFGVTSSLAKPDDTFVLLPYQPILDSVSPETVRAINQHLRTELSARNHARLLHTKFSLPNQPAAPKIQAPHRKATQLANRFEADRAFQRALDQRKMAVAAIKNAPSTATDALTYTKAIHALARALLWDGQDQAAQIHMATAAALRPDFAPDPIKFSILYRQYFDRAVKHALSQPRSELLIQSAFPGTMIFVNGARIVRTPALLRKLIPGTHFITASIEGPQPFNVMVRTRAGERREITLSPKNSSGVGPITPIASAIANNEISPAAIQSAMKLGHDLGAQYIVVGGIAQHHDKLHVHSFLFKTDRFGSTEVGPVSFDLELLAIQSDVVKVADKVEQAFEASFREQKRSVAIDPAIKRRPPLYSVDAERLFMPKRSTKSPQPSPSKKRRIFRPLEKTKIEIRETDP